MDIGRYRMDRPLHTLRPWPQTPLPALPVLVRSCEHIGNGVILQTGTAEARVPDEELYLRELMLLDLEDTEAIVDFCGEFGTLSSSETHESERPVAAYSASEVGLLARKVTGSDLLQVDDFRELARELRDMTRVLLSLSRQETYAEADFEANVVSDTSDDPALARFSWYRLMVTLGLERSFFPRLEDLRADALGRFGGSVDASDTGQRPYVTLYSALCRQHFNAIVEAPTYRRCARESCRQVFVHQRGKRSRYQQHRKTGVLYCSTRCATTEAKRAYRARERDKKRTEGGNDA
jgi:hypothetical protein